MKSAKKSKAKAISRVPQSREDAVFAVGRIGTLRRSLAQHAHTAEEAIRVAGEKLETDTAAIVAELEEHERGVHAWCEANRLSLTNDGKVKFHDFGTGSIKWRSRPPKVTLRGVETIIEACKKLGFTAFIRTSEEVNKDAMLADPTQARLIAGVTISSAGEDFVIEPLELETSAVRA